jgi:hypothetical protein
MWDGTVPNDLANGYDLLLIADEEQQHVSSWDFFISWTRYFVRLKYLSSFVL